MKSENESSECTSVYLFQVDSAKENRPFFEGMHKAVPESVYFRGLDFKVGPWTPDGVRVDLELGTSPRCSLTLIELEPTESMALRSSRKYLHEKSIGICGAFMQYLHRVIEDCDSRADAREIKIALLRDTLAQNMLATIRTAGALRSGAAFLEESLLTDQTDSAQSRGTPQYYISTDEKLERKQLEMRGVLRLSPEQSKVLRRCLSILDAVIREDDLSGATYNSWRLKTPLKNLLKGKGEKPPTLKRFILDQKNSGITIDFELLLSDLVEVWTKTGEQGKQIDLAIARNLIEGYFPIAKEVRTHDDMKLIFGAARLKVSKLLGNQQGF
jgi:hypothetical protein